MEQTAPGACKTIEVMGDYCVMMNLFRSKRVRGKQLPSGEWYFTAQPKAPKEGYMAFYLEAKFSRNVTEGPRTFRTSTEMNIIPDGYPFEDCTLEDCRGTLV